VIKKEKSENRLFLQASYESRYRQSERNDPTDSAAADTQQHPQTTSVAQHQDRHRQLPDEQHLTSLQPQQHNHHHRRPASASAYPYHSAASPTMSRVQPDHRSTKYFVATAPRQRRPQNGAIRLV